MALTDTAVRTAKPADKPRKLFDVRGLFLLIQPAGGKWWRFRYQYEGKDKLLSLGTYPDISLKDARERRDELRKLLANGVDPGEQRKAQKAVSADRAANSFEVITREWFGKHRPNWSDSHADKVIRRFENDVFPWLGARPIDAITPPELLKVVRRIEERGALDTAHRALQTCGQVFRYAVATGRAERDPSSDLRGALPPARQGHFAAVTEPADVGRLLRTLDSYNGSPVVRAALRLAPLVFVRPGELRKARWAEIDLDTAEWRFEVTKTKSQHIVPLARQALDILAEIRPITHYSDYVFPGARSPKRPMSDNALLAALRRLEIPKEEMSGHGFRAMARTILDEVLNFPVAIIEHQLAHAVKDVHGRAYNRTAHLPQRREMMQSWADYLDGVKGA